MMLHYVDTKVHVKVVLSYLRWACQACRGSSSPSRGIPTHPAEIDEPALNRGGRRAGELGLGDGIGRYGWIDTIGCRWSAPILRPHERPRSEWFFLVGGEDRRGPELAEPTRPRRNVFKFLGELDGVGRPDARAHLRVHDEGQGHLAIRFGID